MTGGPRPTKFSEQIVVRLSAQVLDAVKADATANERSVAQTVRLAVKNYLAKAAT